MNYTKGGIAYIESLLHALVFPLPEIDIVIMNTNISTYQQQIEIGFSILFVIFCESIMDANNFYL